MVRTSADQSLSPTWAPSAPCRRRHVESCAAALRKIRSLMCQNDSPMSQYLGFAPQAVLVCRIWSGLAKVSDRWDRRRALSSPWVRWSTLAWVIFTIDPEMHRTDWKRLRRGG